MSAATGAPAAKTQADEKALRFATVSVYYNCLLREGSSGGAPAMALPLPGGPLSLADALAEIQKGGLGAMRGPVWRIVRGTPVGGDYPGALEPALARLAPSLKLDHLNSLRKSYHAGANLLGAALVACAEKQPEFGELRKHMASRKSDFDRATEAVLGMTASRFLSSLDDRRTSAQLRALQQEVGLDLYRYAAEFADAVAFDEWWRAADPAPDGGMVVYPAACVIRQDSASMITRVTVTALARCEDFSALVRSADPQCWSLASDVMAKTQYVHDSYDLTPAPVPAGQGYKSRQPPPYRWLEEIVNVPSGIEGPTESSFHNVLRIDKFNVVDKKDRKTVTVNFSLARSVNSTVLWDTRSGGILVDQGYIGVRRLAADTWRITSHKTLLFSNRTPNMNTSGWFDLGQMLNVLTPAALSWWLESEVYSAADPAYSSTKRSK
ncbi:MAG TPA: hypothetical protein VMD09_10365 [Solirubrobacteraceae bacterium]|nr:hypothetical protein [Solirubrobacteraceae bacterium]